MTRVYLQSGDSERTRYNLDRGLLLSPEYRPPLQLQIEARDAGLIAKGPVETL